MTVVEFLHARLDEEYAAAQAVYDEASDYRVIGSGLAEEHFSNWRPARVLAEVEANRRIVGCAAEQPETMGEVVAHLAEVYDGHPDYDESWRA